ncbi:MAG: hypothetical protein C4519_17560 [Desulfobacteraceae bacterium]|nr:MAG: hypothetical protein C4519_17560 [Desulfobacteraceae bacterium]
MGRPQVFEIFVGRLRQSGHRAPELRWRGKVPPVVNLQAAGMPRPSRPGPFTGKTYHSHRKEFNLNLLLRCFH